MLRPIYSCAGAPCSGVTYLCLFVNRIEPKFFDDKAKLAKVRGYYDTLAAHIYPYS
jgi:hypothetical protein